MSHWYQDVRREDVEPAARAFAARVRRGWINTIEKYQGCIIVRTIGSHGTRNAGIEKCPISYPYYVPPETADAH